MGSVIGLGELKAIRETLRAEKKTVVFTNGCFDIIHRGHVEYLAKAKALGDVLLVGVNTDASTRRIKGNKRPVVGEGDRAFIVANLTAVDYVCMFDEDTPLEIITALQPDVLAKGADWKTEHIVGKDVVERSGGRVATIAVVPNRSTSSIIERILERFTSP